MKNILFIFALVTFELCASAQQSAKDIPERFFQIYKISPDSAFAFYFSSNMWVESDDISKLKSKIKDLTGLLGKYLGYEFITEKSMGGSLKLFSYLAKYERQPIRYIFYLYKPADVWRCQNVSYDLNLRDDLEEAAKAYRMPENLQ